LFPHGVLFRDEESNIRENLVKTDLIECIIGLGANLFFNSPMEACIVICRTKKNEERRGQILLINAINEVTRKNAFSYLEEAHIKKIATAYEEYEDIDGFAKVATLDDIAANRYSLSIPLYVRVASNEVAQEARSVGECISTWSASASATWEAYSELVGLLNATSGEDR
jgi:type I restriction enzyme M protein